MALRRYAVVCSLHKPCDNATERATNIAAIPGGPGRTGTRWDCCSVLAAIAGILYTGSAGGADPTSALTLLLPAFAAAFLGSTTILPGQFNPWGAFVSVYFIVTGITGLAILGLPTFVHSFFYGGALVLMARSLRSTGIAPLHHYYKALRPWSEREDPDDDAK
jgi:ribose/xylose/arabinose/galactoside ABC-type transport system permease subunit